MLLRRDRQNLVHTADEPIRRERFGKKSIVRLQPSICNKVIVRIPGDEQHAQMGAKLGETGRDSATGLSIHAYIGYQELNVR